MKKLILISVLLIAVNSCSQSSEKEQAEGSIAGTWQLVEERYGNFDGSSGNWEQIENGRLITFNADLSYEPEITPSNCGEVNSSSYFLQNNSEMNILEITIECTNPDTVFESQDSYSFENSNYLILRPIEPECPEGCAFKYKKLE